MNTIFERIFDLFLLLWQSIDKLLAPIIDFFISSVQYIIPKILDAVQWILNSIQAIIDFFTGLFGWFS